MNLRTGLRIFQLLAASLLWHESTDLTPNVSVTRRSTFCRESTDLTPNVRVTRQHAFVPWIYVLDSECLSYSPSRFLCHKSTNLTSNVSVASQLTFIPWIYGRDSECFSYSPSRLYAMNLRTWLRMFQLLAISLLCHESMDLTPNVSVTCHPTLCHESTDLTPNYSFTRHLPFLPRM